MDELLAFRSRHALASWEATVRALLDAAAPPQPPPGNGSADGSGAGPVRLGAILPRLIERAAP